MAHMSGDLGNSRHSYCMFRDASSHYLGTQSNICMFLTRLDLHVLQFEALVEVRCFSMIDAAVQATSESQEGFPKPPKDLLLRNWSP